MNRLRTITTIYQQYRTLFVVVLFVVCTLAFMTPLLVSAQSQVLDSHANAGANSSGNSIAHLLYRIVSGFFGWLAGMAAGALSYSIDKFVVGFGALFAGSGLGGAVNLLWGFIRDLFNLAFIFGLIFIGFKLILNSSDSRAKKNLASLIVAALLVNFSLFFTKFVIDFTNVAAVQFVNLIEAGGGATIQLGGNDLGGGTVPDIGGVFIGISGILTLFNNGDIITEATTGGAFAYIFGMMVLLLITTMVFLAGAVLLAIRFVVLNFYMIFSPVMFLGWVFPNMDGYSSKYMKSFLGKAFVAPAYVLLLYISFLIIEQLNGVMLDGRTMGEMFGGANGVTAAAVVPFFLLSSIFMLASVVIAQKLGAEGATASIRIMNNIRGRTQRGLQNTALYVPRASARAATGASARGLRRVDNKLLASGVTFGGRARDKALTAGENAKFGLQYSSQQNIENQRTQQKRANTQEKLEKRDRDFVEQFTRMNATVLTDPKTGEKKVVTDQERAEARAAMAAIVNKMSAEEIQDIARRTNNQAILTSPAVAAALSDAQVRAAADSGNYSNTDMKAIGTARDEGTFDQTFESLDEAAASTDDLKSAFDELGRIVRGLSKDRLESMSVDRLSDERIAMNLTTSQMDSLRNSGKFTPEQYGQIEDARERGFNALASSDLVIRDRDNKVTQDKNGNERRLVSANVQAAVRRNPDTDQNNLDEFVRDQRAQIFRQSAEQAGQLPSTVYTDTIMTEHITPQALQRRIQNGMSESDRLTVERNIRDFISSGTEAGDRAKKQWQQWSRRTTEGANFNFDFPNEKDENLDTSSRSTS